LKKHRILLYHRIIEDNSPPFLLKALSGEVVTQKAFVSQLKWLKSRFEVVPLDEFMSRYETSNHPLAAVTFDDGFADNLNLGVSVIKSLDVSATIFVIAGLIGDVNGMLHHKVARHISNHPNPTNGLSPREQVREFIASGEAHEIQANFSDRFLDEAEVRLLAESAISIESHGQTHTPFNELSEKAGERELKNSKAQLEQIVGDEVKYFAYPMGHAEHFETVKESVVKAAGYEAAFTAVKQELGTTSLFRLPRWGTRESLKDTRRRLKLGFWSR
jgi:peptidoglycan/xylan/chitin deacetylase (PgdA/CDA1 family)